VTGEDWLAIDPTLVAAAGECGYRSLAVLVRRGGGCAGGGIGDEETICLSYEGPFGVGSLVGEVEIAGERLRRPRS